MFSPILVILPASAVKTTLTIGRPVKKDCDFAMRLYDNDRRRLLRTLHPEVAHAAFQH